MIKAYLKEVIRDKRLYMSIALAILFLALFWVYLTFVGRPITMSHNKYNEGVQYQNVGDKQRAKELFTEADEIWPNKNAREALKQLD